MGVKTKTAQQEPTYAPLDFKSEASAPFNGIAVVADLEGFTAFFNRPDVATYIPRYLSIVFSAVNIVFEGGAPFWIAGSHATRVGTPYHTKYLGDGALFIFGKPGQAAPLPTSIISRLVNNLRVVSRDFELINDFARGELPLYELAEGIRFGIARGTIWEITVQGSGAKEYIGFPINLASRLQKYCPGIKLTVSDRVSSKNSLASGRLHRTVATAIRGYPSEYVLVPEEQYRGLDEDVRAAHFLDPPLPTGGPDDSPREDPQGGTGSAGKFEAMMGPR